MEELEFLDVRIENISVSNLGFIVFLRPEGDERVMPIFIGANEAHSIAAAYNKQQLPRPLTHDLLKTVLENLDCDLTKVQITALVENTFYGRIYFRREEYEEFDVDARPSDAIALALRYEVPIQVEKSVFESSALELRQESKMPGSDNPVSRLSPDLADLEAVKPNPRMREPDTQSPLERLQGELARAIADERYEDAARIHQELKEKEKSQK